MSDTTPLPALTDEQIDAIANDGCRNAAGGIYATRVYEFARAIESAIRSAPATVPAWMPIETAPKDERTILLGYPNRAGKWRTVRGQWMSEDYIAEYWEYPDSTEPGWFETAEEAEDAPNCWTIRPTHWMPLPAAPGAAAPTPPAAQPAPAGGLLESEIKPRPLSYSLSDYHRAMADGPLHYTWQDKPHRLVYDLIAAVRYYAAPQQPEPRSSLQPPAEASAAVVGAGPQDEAIPQLPKGQVWCCARGCGICRAVLAPFEYSETIDGELVASRSFMRAVSHCCRGDLCVWDEANDCEAPTPSFAGLGAKPAGEPTRSQRLREAGFTARDTRLTCDECGDRYTEQMAPLHKCATPTPHQPAGGAERHATVEEWEETLSTAMPPDFKDWWENSKKEWPAIALGVIQAARKSEAVAWKMLAPTGDAVALAAEAVLLARRLHAHSDPDITRVLLSSLLATIRRLAALTHRQADTTGGAATSAPSRAE